jgi:hypothetical protein
MSSAGPTDLTQVLLASEKIYLLSADSELRYGEIISNVPQAYLAAESVKPTDSGDQSFVVSFKIHPLAVVVSQDCDLEQEFKARTKEAIATSLPNILFCEVFEAEAQRQRLKKEDVWRRIFQNQDQRYQYLRAVSQDEDLSKQGIPAMIVDFKRYFTIPTAELYSRLSLDTKRRCQLDGPYAQHLVSRFFNYQSRVGLPVDHHR